jgi:hypothetical protein
MNEFYAFVGRWYVQKYRRLYASTYDAARRLRKEGVPLAVALLVLVGRV